MSLETKVISAFPACGKSYYFENIKDKEVLDSDSSEFSWIKDKNGKNTKVRNPNFPMNYISHIKENLGKVDIIFVSSHDNVREALREANINYSLVYPNIDLKEEWIERFKKRGNNMEFINFISANWDNFIRNIEEETFPILIKLEKNIFISDILNLDK